MVTVRRQPSEGSIVHWRDWITQLVNRAPVRERALLEQACERAEQCQLAGEAAGRGWPYGKGCLDIGLEMGEVLVDLGADSDILPAAILYRAVREGQITLLEVEKEFGIPVVSIIRLEQVLDYLKANPEFAGHAEKVASYRDRYGV